MSMMKRWLEDLSVEMGYDGAITDEVMAEGEKRLRPEPLEEVEVSTCVGCGTDFCYTPADHNHSAPDLCKKCATVACEEGLSSYAEYIRTPDPPYYVSPFKTAVPFPTDSDIPEEEIENDAFEG